MRFDRLVGFVFMVVFFSAAVGRTQEPPAEKTNAFSEAIADLNQRFHGLKPTLVLDYEGAYALMGMELKGRAALRIAVTEGTWKTSESAAPVPACQLDIRLFNPREKQDDPKDPVSLNKRNLCVLSMPDLKLLRYIKLNDEMLKPLFGRNRLLKYVETYDFEGEDVRYLRHDLVSGVLVTNLPNLDVMARQTFEIGEVLQNIHKAYVAEDSTNQPVAEMHFNVNGHVKKFGLHTRKATLHAPILQREATVLRGDILGVGQKSGGNNCFSVSCLPFREVAASREDPQLDVLAAEGQDWYMIPVAGRYELFLGGIICTLTGIRGEENGPILD